MALAPYWNTWPQRRHSYSVAETEQVMFTIGGLDLVGASATGELRLARTMPHPRALQRVATGK
jgi:hypothetical protein